MKVVSRSARVLNPLNDVSAEWRRAPEVEMQHEAVGMASVRVGDYLWCIGGRVEVRWGNSKGAFG